MLIAVTSGKSYGYATVEDYTIALSESNLWLSLLIVIQSTEQFNTTVEVQEYRELHLQGQATLP